MSSSRLPILASVAVVVVACSSLTGNQDPRACAQTSEFGNYGCVEVFGTVVDADERGLYGIIVGPVYLPGKEGFNTNYGGTDVDGRFRFRVSRFTAPVTTPDTVSFYVRAADPRTAGVGIPATLRDSVLVTATVTPVGRIPVPTTVTISLVAK